MPRVSKPAPKSQPKPVAPAPFPVAETTTLALIQALLPLGLQAAEEALVHEVMALAGQRYAHDNAHLHLAR